MGFFFLFFFFFVINFSPWTASCLKVRLEGKCMRPFFWNFPGSDPYPVHAAEKFFLQERDIHKMTNLSTQKRAVIRNCTRLPWDDGMKKRPLSPLEHPDDVLTSLYQLLGLEVSAEIKYLPRGQPQQTGHGEDAEVHHTWMGRFWKDKRTYTKLQHSTHFYRHRPLRGC